MEALEKLVGQRIRALRKTRGWTQEELATRAQKSVFTLSQLERGTNLPNLRTLVDLAYALDCGMDELVLGHSHGKKTKRTREHLALETQLHNEISGMDIKTLKAVRGAITAIFDAQS